jgi:hypothetical protein
MFLDKFEIAQYGEASELQVICVKVITLLVRFQFRVRYRDWQLCSILCDYGIVILDQNRFEASLDLYNCH